MNYINGKFFKIGDLVKLDDGIIYKIIGFTKLKLKGNVLFEVSCREQADVEINDDFYMIGEVIHKIDKRKVIEQVYPKYLPP